MSIFDSLPAAPFADAPRPGYQARQRTEVEDKTLDELDLLVEEADGRPRRKQLRSEGIGAGRMSARAQRATWYELPDGAFDAP